MKRIDWTQIMVNIYIFILASTPLIILGCIILRISVFLVYGNTPITEIPSWAFWIMGTGK